MVDRAEGSGRFALRCRSTLLYRGMVLRCWKDRWHFNAHQGEDIEGPTWTK